MLKYFSFNGRAKRREYWGVAIVLFFAGILLQIVSFSLLFLGPVALLLIPLTIAMIWLSLAVIARRLRDIKISRWYMLLLLVPFVNFIPFIAWGCIKSR